ncbi:MAG: hypothetical protein ACK5JO_04430 [Halodesulfovibrio sp.]
MTTPALSTVHCHAETQAELVVRGGVSRFVLLDRITGYSCGTGGSMTTYTALQSAPDYLALECMAQCAAMHLRVTLRFERHVFLLGMRDVQLSESSSTPQPIETEKQNGEFGILLTGTIACTATRTGETDSGASYTVVCRLLTPDNGPGAVIAQGEVLLSSLPYSEQFPEQVLRPHYEALFHTLTGGTPPISICTGARP